MPDQCTNVAAIDSERVDLAAHRANAGPIPRPKGIATRRFIIRLHIQANGITYGGDNVP